MELSPLSHSGFNADNDGDQLHAILRMRQMLICKNW